MLNKIQYIQYDLIYFRLGVKHPFYINSLKQNSVKHFTYFVLHKHTSLRTGIYYVSFKSIMM